MTSWTAAIATAKFGYKSLACHPHDRSQPRSMVQGPKFNFQTTTYFSDFWGAVGMQNSMLDVKRAQVGAHCQIYEHPSRYLSRRDLFCGGKKLCASAEPSSISFDGMAHADTAQPFESIISFSLFGQTLLLPHRMLGLVQDLVFSWQFYYIGTTIVTHFSQQL